MTEANGKRGGVAAGHRGTAEAAVRVLDAGGNAFDAAIAGFLAACVAEPVLASLGGGGFLTARTAAGEIECFDFFTETPLRRPNPDEVDFHPIVADFGAAQQGFHIGLGAVATPGAVAGIFAVHEALGRLPMTEIAAPAIELASNGIRINAFQAYLLGVVGPIYVASPGSVRLFCDGVDASGSPTLLAEGGLYRPSEYADFLEALAHEGAPLFYKGEVAARIDGMAGATIGASDLAAYRVQRRRPVRAELAGHAVHLNPPPAIGGALIAWALAALERSALDAFGSVRHVGALVEAMRLAEGARRDSGIDHDPVAGAAALARQAAAHPPAYRGTTHISVADAEGNLAAVTVSNGEGCGHVIPGTGVMLNNMLGEDDLNAAGFFQWREGVRMSSMMTPGLIASPDGSWTAFGSGGSNRIRSALTQVLINLACFGMPVDDAVERPRMHYEGGKLSIEPGFSEDAHAVARGLAEDVHLWPDRNMFFGGAHLVSIAPGGGVAGAGDPRRDGVFQSA